MKIASFNVNSVRARLPIVIGWLAEQEPDVLCLQETKVQDQDFPVDAFTEAGYHVAFRGEKAYNGVAVVTKEEPSEVAYGLDDRGDPDEARLIRVRLGELAIVNTYVPQGTDPTSPKFQYKLKWFGRLQRFFKRHYEPTDLLLWAGDLNVAPTPLDVYDPDRLYGCICYHPDEHKALKKVTDWGFVDVFRKHCPEPQQYTYYDYRFPKAIDHGLGWRVDHLLATAPLAERSTAAYIDLQPRRLKRPSDHTPIVAEFA